MPLSLAVTAARIIYWVKVKFLVFSRCRVQDTLGFSASLSLLAPPFCVSTLRDSNSLGRVGNTVNVFGIAEVSFIETVRGVDYKFSSNSQSYGLDILLPDFTKLLLGLAKSLF